MNLQLGSFQKYQESWASWYRYVLAMSLMEVQHNLSSRKLRILDAASGNGVIAEPLLKQGHSVVLFDISPDMIDAAKDSLADTYKDTVSFYVGSLNDDLPRWEADFDLVIMHHIIEYLPDITPVFRRLAHQVKPGSSMSLITLNPVSEVLRRIHFDNSPVDALDKLNDLAYDARWFGNAQMYSDEQLTMSLNEAGWDVVDRRGMRIFSDYIKDSRSEETSFPETMLELELKVAGMMPYRDIGRYRQWACTRRE
ncbi:MAG: methyltransferase domain-containing protein [Burkholderiales bacterium]|nr:methyltransferase domain-containing protein [Anaerolineae bacterium]